MNHQKIQNQITADIPTGKLPFRMTSDILFKVLMQSSKNVLRGHCLQLSGLSARNNQIH